MYIDLIYVCTLYYIHIIDLSKGGAVETGLVVLYII